MDLLDKLFLKPIKHNPPKSCITQHFIAVGEESNKNNPNNSPSSNSCLTKAQRIKNANMGVKRCEDIDKLIKQMNWQPFTATDLVKKAQELEFIDVDQKAYSRRLQVLMCHDVLLMIGKRSREFLYIAKR